VVARVDGEEITAEEVGLVARAERIADARAALERTIALRLAAREAERRGLADDPLVQDTMRRAEIQALLASMVEREVREDNLPPAELEAGMRTHGFELSHGELWRTAHVLLQVPPSATPEARAQARARMEEFQRRAAALPPPRGAETFEALARAQLPAAETRVERLPPIDRTGRHARGELVPAFAQAATALERPGDVSPVVETPYGFHVILLLERLPAQHRPEEEVRATIRSELLWRLRHRALERYLASLHERYRTQVRDEALRAVERIRIAGEAP
jgi:peptidyl-prolyl cis-trans isomerase C